MIGRRGMLNMAKLDNGLEVIRITCDSPITTAEGAAQFFTEKVPQCLYAIIALDRDFDTPPEVNSTFVNALWRNGTSGSVYARYRNGAYQTSMSSWSSAYDVKIAQGATLTVAYIKPLA